MSLSLSKHSSIRRSGHSLVVTIPSEIVKELSLSDGDSVFWEVNKTKLYLAIAKLEQIMGIPLQENAEVTEAEEEEVRARAIANEKLQGWPKGWQPETEAETEAETEVTETANEEDIKK
jgi:antitoxin component of MazEF toxin-antitoxin module